MTRIILCTVCPQGCEVAVTGEPGAIESITGNGCQRGLSYAESEFSHPLRTLTSLVRTKGCKRPLVPVRTTKPIPRELLLACVDELRAVTVASGLKRGDVVIANVLDTGADIVATADA